MPGRAFTREFKLTLVRQIASGQTPSASVAQVPHLAESVLIRWHKAYNEWKNLLIVFPSHPLYSILYVERS